MRARPMAGLLCGLSALAVTAVGTITGYAARSEAGTTPPQPAAPRSRTVTLVTGERVTVSSTDATHITAVLDPGSPVAGGGTTGAVAATETAGHRRFETLVAGTAQYVVPDEALPYIGHQLDMSLFNVAAPPAELRVDWATGAGAHPIPGLAFAAGGSAPARVSSAAAFAAALASGPAALDGVRTIRAAGAAAPSPSAVAESPQFNLATLIVRGLDRLGAAAVGGSVSVINVDDTLRFVSLSSFFNGTVAFSVPEGRYTLTADISTPSSGGVAQPESLVVLGEVTVGAPQTVVVADARTATALVPVPATPLPSQVEQFSATLDRVSASGAQATFTEGFIGGIPQVYVTPVAGVATGTLHWYTYFRLDGTPSSTVDGLPYLYDIETPSDGTIPDHFPTQVDAGSLATVDAAYHSDVPGHAIYTYRASFLPWETFTLRPVSPATAPLRRVEYVTGRPDIAWVGALVWQVDEFNGFDQAPRTILAAGQRYPDVYLRAPLVPGVDGGVVLPQPCGACRQGDTLGLSIEPWSDGGHAVGGLAPSATLDVSSDTRLYADGVQIYQSSQPAGTATVPDAPAEFRLTLDTVKSAAWTTTATRSRTAWTWHSTARAGTLPPQRTCPDGTQDCAFEPLLFAAYDLGADLSNALPAGRAATFAVRVRHQPFQAAPDADALTLDVSTDDGATWAAAAVTGLGGGQFTVAVPGTLLPGTGTGWLSVRIHASDPLGDTIDQTITRAARVVQGA